MLGYIKTFAKKSLLVIFGLMVLLGPVPVIEIAKEKIVFSVNIPSASAQSQDASNLDLSDLGISCGIENIDACIISGFFYLFYLPTSALVEQSARLQDALIYLSIQDFTYRSPLIEEGWRILRDFSNLIFIFGIVFVAISLILDIGGGQKKQIVNILIVATLINFSLFAGRIIVDFGNIFAFALYEQISVVSSGSTSTDAVKAVGLGFLSITNPLKILSSITTGSIEEIESTFALLTAIGIVFNLALIWLFVSVSFFFLKRIIGIYIALIFSPLAFASYALPGGGDKILSDFSLRKWFNNLVQMSISAGVYMMLIYLAINFLNAGLSLVTITKPDNSLSRSLFEFILNFSLTMGFLIKGKAYVESAVADVSRVVDKAVGTAVGFAAGGLALGAKFGVGAVRFVGKNQFISDRINKNLQNTKLGNSLGIKDDGKTLSERVTDMSKSENKITGFVGRNLNRIGTKLDATSFDVRQNKFGSRALGTFLGKDVMSNSNGGLVQDFGFQSGGAISRSRIDDLKADIERQKKWAELALIKGQAAQLRDAKAKNENKRQKIAKGRRNDFDNRLEDFENKIIADAEASLDRVLSIEERNSLRLTEQERQNMHREFLKNGSIDAKVKARELKDADGNIFYSQANDSAFQIANDKKGRIRINELTEDGYVAGKIKRQKAAQELFDLEIQRTGSALEQQIIAEIAAGTDASLAQMNAYENIRRTGEYNGESIENNIEADKIMAAQAARLTEELGKLGITITQQQEAEMKLYGQYIDANGNLISSVNNYLNYLDKNKELEEKGLKLSDADRDIILKENKFQGNKLKDEVGDARKTGIKDGKKIETLEEQSGFAEKRWKLSTEVNSEIMNEYVKQKRDLIASKNLLENLYAFSTGWGDGVSLFTTRDGAGSLVLQQLEDQYGSGSENIQRVTQIRDQIKDLDDSVYDHIKKLIESIPSGVDVGDGEKADDFLLRFKREAGDSGKFTIASTELREKALLLASESYEAEVKAQESAVNTMQQNANTPPEVLASAKIKLRQMKAVQARMKNYEKDRRGLESQASVISQKIKDE